MVAEAAYYARPIERWGTGTSRMAEQCQWAGLPAPVFAGGFNVVLRKDAYTAAHLTALGLNERQVRAVLHIKAHGAITAAEHQALTGALQADGVAGLGPRRRCFRPADRPSPRTDR